MNAPSESTTTSSAITIDPAATPPAQARALRAWLRPVLLTVAALAVASWLAHFLFRAYHYEETDDAYVIGHLHQISPQVEGQVKEVLVADNQNVRAGDVLLRLDPLGFEIARQKAQAGLAQARAQETQALAAARQTEAQIAEAQARVVQAEAQLKQTAAQLELARLTLGRQEQLATHDGASTQADLDNARSVFSTAQAAHAANQANLVAAQAGVGSAQAAQASARAQALAAIASDAPMSALAAVRPTPAAPLVDALRREWSSAGASASVAFFWFR